MRNTLDYKITRIVLTISVLLLLGSITNAQSRVITKGEYDAAFGYAVRTTNAAFPFVFTVTTDTYENGKLAWTEKEVEERQAQGVERITKSLIEAGKTLRSYQVMVGFGNVYCSTDGKAWKGPQKFECPGPDGSGTVRLYGPRKPESVEYTVTEKAVKGQRIKMYREYTVFPLSRVGAQKEFKEKISTMNADGLLIDIVDTEGTLDPRTVTLTRKQTWKLNAKFAPVTAPK
jgi:hypothetical protein